MDSNFFLCDTGLESFKEKNDIDIINLVKDGDSHALNYLLSKYKELVFNKVSKYYIIGAEREDLIQEGLIGLYKAIKDFNEDKQNSFKSFALLCIERQLITAIKTSNRQKHIPLNSSVSLNNTVNSENDDSCFLDIFNANVIEDPLETITKKEYYSFLQNKIESNLSDFEKQVLYKYANGYSYNTIAEQLDSPIKSIDNAIQRIRKKITKM